MDRALLARWMRIVSIWTATLLVGAAAIAVAAALLFEARHAAPRLIAGETIESLMAGIDPARVEPIVDLRAENGEGWRVISFGSADCGACRRWAETLDAAAASMRDAGLSFGHVHLAHGRLSIDAVNARACHGAPESLAAGAEGLRALYAAAEAMASIPSGAARLDPAARAAADAWRAVAGPASWGYDCALAREAAAEDQAGILRRFGVVGTPSFAVAAPEGVYVVLGDPGADALRALADGAQR